MPTEMFRPHEHLADSGFITVTEGTPTLVAEAIRIDHAEDVDYGLLTPIRTAVEIIESFDSDARDGCNSQHGIQP
ncbi:MAG: hypothetical protein ACQ5SW_13760 [Sphaerochaetaceae bacterium]